MTSNSRSAVLKVGSLLLDAKNTRIPAAHRSDNQRQLLHYLLQHEDVKGLAASIAKLGLFPNERLVVSPERGRLFTVLEGNRRLAAIKLLLNPELAPTVAQVRAFRTLSARANLSALGKLDAVIVPDRVAAAPIIASIHTRESKRRWSSLQQARFYRELVEEGQTPTDIAEQLGIALGQVSGYLRAEKLYQAALTLEYPKDIRDKLEDARFPLTTLERFLESKTARRFLGIALDDQHGFVGHVHPERFKAVLGHVARDVATTSGLTRRINDEEGFKQYILEAEAAIPKTKVRGSFTPDLLLGNGKTPTEPESPPAPRVRQSRPQKPSASVVPRGFVCSSRNERVRAIFDELKGISITDQRNSTGVMLRVLLDVALWSYLKAENHAIGAIDHFDPNGKKRGYNPDWTPPLRDLISYVVDNRLLPGMSADGYKAVRSLASKDANYFITIDGFNQFTHNPHVTPTEGDLRALWQRAEPMLEIILAP